MYEMINSLPFPTMSFELHLYSDFKVILFRSFVTWYVAPLSRNHRGSLSTSLVAAMYAAFCACCLLHKQGAVQVVFLLVKLVHSHHLFYASTHLQCVPL